jgi:hypothetical protein
MTYQNDPQNDPNFRRREIEPVEDRADNSLMMWIIGGAAALAVAAFLAFGMSSNSDVATNAGPSATSTSSTANTPAPRETTGSGNMNSPGITTPADPATPRAPTSR